MIIQPSDGNIRLGGQQGRPPSLDGAPDTGPRLGHEIGTSEDTFEVYRGGVESPLDSSPVWRYIAKDALSRPRVSAVEQFRKTLAESVKQQQQKP